MAWGTIRPATDEDYENLNKAARRFAARHPEVHDHMHEGDPITDADRGVTWYASVTNAVDFMERYSENGKYIAMLWKRCFRRAVDEPSAEGIAWGHIGSHVD
jgi:gluconate kinase